MASPYRTFGGNPVTATAAKAVIDYIAEHELLTNAAETGAHLRARLEDLKERYPLIGDVRGMGLMQALELVKDRESKAPARESTARLLQAARDNRCSSVRAVCTETSCGSYRRSTSESHVDEFASRLDAAFATVSNYVSDGATA